MQIATLTTTRPRINQRNRGRLADICRWRRSMPLSRFRPNSPPNCTPHPWRAGNLWNEYMPDLKQAEFMAFPRLLSPGRKRTLVRENRTGFCGFQPADSSKRAAAGSTGHQPSPNQRSGCPPATFDRPAMRLCILSVRIQLGISCLTLAVNAHSLSPPTGCIWTPPPERRFLIGFAHKPTLDVHS